MKTCYGHIVRILLFFVCMAWSSESIHVEVKDEQPNNDGMLGLRMRVINNSGQSYNGVQVRYFLKKRLQDTFVLDTYYMDGMTAQLEQLDDTTVVLSIGVPILGPGTIPNADGISVGIHRQDWNSVHKRDLSGYPGNEFAEAVNYGVYMGESLIAGTLLPVDASEATLKLRFVGVRPETGDSLSSWVQLQNYGKSPVSLHGVKIKDANGALQSLGNMTIGAMSTLRVCNGPVSDCAYDSAITSISGLSFGKVGEFVLYQDSVPLDYIAWGARGSFADSLEIEDRVIDPDKFFNTSEDPVVGPVSVYRKGDFFRAIIEDGSDSIVGWNKFRENMIDFPFSQRPLAEPFVLLDGSSVYKRSGEGTMLSWIPVAGAKSYEVTVLKAGSADVVYRGYTSTTKIPLQLPGGEYRWQVIPVEANEEDSYRPDIFVPWESVIPSEYHNKFSVYVLEESAEPEVDLHVDPLAARKDSYMLDLKWGEHINEAEWDRPHNSSGYVDQYGNRRFTDPMHFYHDAEESWRCWAVATTELNHFYRGNLTQDEVKFHYMSEIKFQENRILKAFPHDDEGGGFPKEVLLWALDFENIQESFGWQYYPGDAENTIVFSGLRISDAEMLAALNAGYPVVIWENNHVMLVDAAIKVEGTPYGFPGKEGYVYRFHNIDNDGTVSWRPISPYPITQEYYIIRNPADINRVARKSELYEDTNNNGIMELSEVYDADGDGLLDFDEYYRFGTYHENLDYDADGNGLLDFDEYRRFAAVEKNYNRDYDNDGIDDKTEIMSYTIREKYPEPVFGDYGVEVEFFADVDGDGLRAEKDPDSDGDGKGDGEEDANHNGLKEKNETDVFIKDNNQIVPSNITGVTLYALSELSYNDGVTCYNGNMPTGYCSVASAAQGVDEDFAAKVGARSTVGNIYSRGRVLLRSDTHVKGGIYLAGYSSVDDIYMQNGSSIDNGITNMSLESWDLNFLPQSFNLEDYSSRFDAELIVPSGRIEELKPGYYSFVKVEGGGTLNILPGTIYIGSIQLDSRSEILYSAPGQKTEMHINGDFTWRAKTINDAAEYSAIARGFKLIQHASEKRMYIDNMVAGNIVAPYSEVIAAQSRKLFYGTIFAKKVFVHQYATIYHVDFNPDQGSLVVSMGGV